MRCATLMRVTSATAHAGKVLSRCGKCLRYMKLISVRPMRIYCPTCEEVLNLPQVPCHLLARGALPRRPACMPMKAPCHSPGLHSVTNMLMQISSTRH